MRICNRCARNPSCDRSTHFWRMWGSPVIRSRPGQCFVCCMCAFSLWTCVYPMHVLSVSSLWPRFTFWYQDMLLLSPAASASTLFTGSHFFSMYASNTQQAYAISSLAEKVRLETDLRSVTLTFRELSDGDLTARFMISLRRVDLVLWFLHEMIHMELISQMYVSLMCFFPWLLVSLWFSRSQIVCS